MKNKLLILASIKRWFEFATQKEGGGGVRLDMKYCFALGELCGSIQRSYTMRSKLQLPNYKEWGMITLQIYRAFYEMKYLKDMLTM